MQFLKRDKKHRLLYGVVLISVCGAVAGLLYFSGEKENEISYRDVTVEKTTIQRTLTAAGEISAGSTEEIGFSTTKVFTAMCVEEDEAVVSGEKLARYKNGTYLTAPANGVVTAVNAPATATAAGEDNAITLSLTDELLLNVTVPEDEIGLIAVGDEATVIMNADSDMTYTGTISYLGAIPASSQEESTAGGDESMASFSGGSATSSGDTSYYKVSIALANDEKLRIGMGAGCTILLESKSDVVAVPVDAVCFNGDRRYVEVVADNGDISKVTVTTGISDADMVEITDGLTGGETVRVTKIG